MNQNMWIIVGDGAASGNPGKGGFGAVVISPNGKVKELGGALNPATNNQMELQSLISGLEWVSESGNVAMIKVVMDSTYVLDGFSKSLVNWKKNSWKTSAGQPLKNPEYWQKLDDLKSRLEGCGFTFQYQLVKGHSGMELNERVDQIAVAFSIGKGIDLFSGDASEYPIGLSLDESQSKFEPVYLCLINGVLSRFKTWPECEEAVKGKTGVKYKKVTNRLQENELLTQWKLR